jgi:hypothetical protein
MHSEVIAGLDALGDAARLSSRRVFWDAAYIADLYNDG